MHWISIMLIAIASNLDNLGIGVSFGMRSTRIPILSNIIIAIITMMGTFISMTLGEYVTRYLSDSAANMLGAAIIIVIGIWTILGTLRKHVVKIDADETSNNIVGVIRDPSTADIDHNKVISFKESFTLGIALALNNIATGIGAGATGVAPLWTTLAAGLFSILFIGTGSRVGLIIARTWFGRYSIIISGVLLISIGIYEMIA